MQKLLTLILILLSISSQAQQAEFEIYENGLIYSPETMSQLGKIVDSLNLQFQSCDLDKTYYTQHQGKAHLVSIPNQEARNLIRNGISFEEYNRRFPKSIVDQEIWLVRHKYKNYNGERKIKFAPLPGAKGKSIYINQEEEKQIGVGWILDEMEDQAIFLVQWKPKPIPAEYARMIQYVDCMIDSTTQIYFSGKEEIVFPLDENKSAARFVAWARKFEGEPQYEDYDDHWDDYTEDYRSWDSLRLIDLDVRMESKPMARQWLTQALEEAFNSGNSSWELELYIARYVSKVEALQLKRSRKVVGTCSMDQSPRLHAMEICMLAAETIQWDIFLRSHLDIMNDRFDRVSDGSYAWGGRKTYLGELEALNINATDLLLGSCLRSESTNDGHYLGYINRVGRALSETKNKEEVERQILTAVSDERLDWYNRTLFAFLFIHYSYNLVDETRKRNNIEKLKAVTNDFPEGLKRALDWEKG